MAIEERQHSLVGPSNLTRCLNCPRSARFEEQFPDRDTSYALEGTMAHAIGERLLEFYKHTDRIAVFDEPWAHLADFLAFDKTFKELADDVDNHGWDFQEMLEIVHDKYTAPVWEDFIKARAEDPKAQLLVETRLNLGAFIPEGIGTADAIIIHGSKIHVIDLKFGRGVRVSAKRNPQMMAYALGALVGPGEDYHISEVEMTIIQPRLGAYSSDTLTVRELAKWAAEVLVPGAKAAFAGEGDFVPGDHCEFCKGKAYCKALAEYCSRITNVYPEATALLPEELGKVLESVGIVEMWASAVRAKAMEMLSEGVAVPGWKLVEGRSVRKIMDTDKAIETLKQAGFGPADYFKPSELKGITDLERLVGKKNFATLLGEYVGKQPGKPALAPESDPRSAYVPSAEAEFTSNL